MFLGPVVAAQQVLVPSPQTSHPREEKRGGGGGAHPLQPSLEESIPGSGYMFTSSGCLGKVFYFSIYIVLCIKDFLRLSLISF